MFLSKTNLPKYASHTLHDADNSMCVIMVEPTSKFSMIYKHLIITANSQSVVCNKTGCPAALY